MSEKTGRRVHMTRGALPRLEIVEQKPGSKPRGLWYGIDDSWLEWCRSEMPDWVGTDFHVLDIDDSRLLKISTARELREFGREFCCRPDITGHPSLESYFIDWARVAAIYGGIEITPYQYSERFGLKSRWYYGWDVASGCIWDPALVESVERVGLAEFGTADVAEKK